MPKRILIIMAMAAEARPIIDQLGLKALPADPRLQSHFPRFQGEFAGKEIVISLNGKSTEYGVDRIGTEFAALNTQSAIVEFAPELIINAGTCGAFSADADIADIITSDQPVVYHDHRVPLKGFDRFAMGAYPTAYCPEYFQGIEHKLGVVTTGNSLDMPDIDRQWIRQNQGMAKEMECAAVAATAHLYGIDFLPIKSVTDHIDIELDNVEQFLNNLSKASQKLSETLIRVLTNIK
ncbi:5'-methylthioadenosine nucleosidase [Endozoicomonas acroporae]|uniref:phosphorylase family protein n=1 Tax=Endozoicomonas acroporae TaxID=1701104 RepID=UPI0013D8C884|nr:5'-methylthioadenosine nucleosidase [Endozoicomonas acroporae]